MFVASHHDLGAFILILSLALVCTDVSRNGSTPQAGGLPGMEIPSAVVTLGGISFHRAGPEKWSGVAPMNEAVK